MLHDISRVAAHFNVKLTLIVDVIHVLQRIWDAGKCFFPNNGAQPPAAAPAALPARGSGKRSRKDEELLTKWVNDHFLTVLEGRAVDVAAGIRQSATKRKLTDDELAAADATCDYLIKHKEHLRYDQYLRAGFPIATGVVEGACRHLDKDRMDITGARWGLESAEAVLRLRSLTSSGDFDEYWRFHLQQECERNHRVLYPPLSIEGDSLPTSDGPNPQADDQHGAVEADAALEFLKQRLPRHLAKTVV